MQSLHSYLEFFRISRAEYFVAIPAWIIGKKELGEIDAGRSPENGRTMAKIGMWLGIVNVILSVIAIFVMIVLFLFGVLSMDDYTSI